MNTQNQNYWLTQFKKGLRGPNPTRPKTGYVLPQYATQYNQSTRLSTPKNPTITFQKRVD